MTNSEDWSLRDLQMCFEGAIPASVATASAKGTPNVTFLSRVRMVDGERVALSNQFFSKTARNLVENPRASLLVMDPTTYCQWRLTLAYERTDRRGPVFELLREDVDAVAVITGMQDVFRLRAADIYRVLNIEPVPADRLEVTAGRGSALDRRAKTERGDDTPALAELSRRFARCPDLDAVVATAVEGLAELFGYDHSMLMLLDEDGTRLYTIASHGYPAQGIGSETAVGEGIIGMAAARGVAMRLGGMLQMAKYSQVVRASYQQHGEIGPGCEVPMPGLAGAQSRVAVPALALGQLVGVLVVDSREEVAFTEADEALLAVVASMLGSLIEIDRSRSGAAENPPASPQPTLLSTAKTMSTTRVRYYRVDGSTFIDGEYLIKGVAGRLLWSLLLQHESEGRAEFTNKEVRLDASLELPAFRDNFESRLVLLKRRLDEREAPIRIEKTRRGRFRLEIDGAVSLDPHE